MTMRYPALCLLFFLPGCAFIEALIAALRAEPQFAFIRNVPAQAGSDTTVEVTVGTVTAAGEAYLFPPVQPQSANVTVAHGLVWDGTGDRLAVAFQELFPGGFDDWIHIYDAELQQQFAGSDDTMGSNMAAGCAPMDAPQVQSAADLLISEGALPAGSVAKFRPGTGVIQGASFTGWLSPDAFVVTLYHEPETFALAPDGSEHDLSVITGTATLGEFVNLSATFSEAGGTWAASGCTLTPPAIPARPAPAPAVTVDAAGALLADGVPLSDQSGDAIADVVLVDGSY